MVCFEKHAAAVAVALSFVLLCCGGVVVADDPPSSSSTAKHGKTKVHVRKLHNLAAELQPVMSTEKRKTTVARSECSEDAVVVSQDQAGRLPGGAPSYSVTITNTCLSCTVRDVHVSCGQFGSAKLVDAGEFRRVTAGDCLVRDGGAMRPGDIVSFEYSNLFQYDLEVASVSCSCS